MKKKDNGRMKDNSYDKNDDMSIDELLRGLSEVGSSETADSSSVVDNDPEIEALLKKYISEGEVFETEDIPVMDTPAYDNIDADAETDEYSDLDDSPAPVRSMRFKIKSHVRNGVELICKSIPEELSPEVSEPTVIVDETEISAAEETQVEEYDMPSSESAEPEVSEEFIDDELTDYAEEIIPELEQIDGNISFDELEMTGDFSLAIDEDEVTEEEEIIDSEDEELVFDEADEAYSEEEEYSSDVIEEGALEDTAFEEAETVIIDDEQIVEAENVEEAQVVEEIQVLEEAEGTEETEEADRELTTDEAIAEYIKMLSSSQASAPIDEPAVEETPATEEYTGAGIESNIQRAESDTFDETDINLMLALGLEDELAKTVGIDAVSKLSQRMERKSDEARRISAPSADEVRFTEYVHSSQNREIQDDYRKAYSGIIFKIIATFILAVGLFLFENISLFGIELSGPFNVSVYPIVYYMVELQLLLFVIAVMYRNFFPGLGRLFSLRPTPDSLLSAAGIVALLYTIVLCVFRVSDGAHLMGFPVALIAVLTSFYEFFNLRREILSFNIVSAKKMKYALTLKSEEDMVAERSVFSEYIDEYSTVADLEKVSFVDGFVSRSEREPYYGNRVIIGILIPFVAAAIMMIISVVKDGSWVSALSGCVSTFMFCVPATILYAYSVPFYRAERAAYVNDGAIIGEDALDEFASTAIIAFDDDEVFDRYGVKVRSVKMYGDNRIDKVIYNTASIFNGLGGLLGDVFRVAAGELGHSDNVEYEEIADFGIKSKVDGEVFYAGSREYIESHGIVIPEEKAEIGLYDDDSISVMYLATEKSAAAKIYISYALEHDFDDIATELDGAGICLAVNSTDPNITEEMLKSKMPQNRYPVKVIRRNVKKAVPEEEAHVNSGIIARGGARSLLTSILLCDKVRHVIGTNTAVKIISALLGAIISSLIIITGNGSNMTSVFSGLYQLLWYLPMMIISRMYI